MHYVPFVSYTAYLVTHRQKKIVTLLPFFLKSVKNRVKYSLQLLNTPYIERYLAVCKLVVYKTTNLALTWQIFKAKIVQASEKHVSKCLCLSGPLYGELYILFSRPVKITFYRLQARKYKICQKEVQARRLRYIFSY